MTKSDTIENKSKVRINILKTNVLEIISKSFANYSMHDMKNKISMFIKEYEKNRFCLSISGKDSDGNLIEFGFYFESKPKIYVNGNLHEGLNNKFIRGD